MIEHRRVKRRMELKFLEHSTRRKACQRLAIPVIEQQTIAYGGENSRHKWAKIQLKLNPIVASDLYDKQAMSRQDKQLLQVHLVACWLRSLTPHPQSNSNKFRHHIVIFHLVIQQNFSSQKLDAVITSEEGFAYCKLMCTIWRKAYG
ncbi:hypothetical protein VNO77_04920 [Canavalia gladiata]|uniref:Uncharacterized protein n=1 Tax=Canavalia gladiata TaxID=3824 RepID=A0AAN9N2J1_CANGL